MKTKLLLTLVALTFSIGTWANEIDGINYILNDNNRTASVTYTGTSSSYNNYKGNVIIPSSITYNGSSYSVTSIGEWAFSHCSSLTSITIPNSVTSIGEWAFYECWGLTKAEFASVESLCGIAFKDWRSNPLSTADHLYIDGKEVTDLVIPESVTSIGNYAFYCCSGLTSIIIPESVTSIGNEAFYGCTGLTSITIPNSVPSIGEYAFYKCSGLTSIIIPESVTSIGNEAFYGCTGLTSITIPEGVTSIGYRAFKGCSGLTSISISKSDIYIGEGAFNQCEKLSSVTLNCPVIGTWFRGIISIQNVTLGNSVKEIGNYAFEGCSEITSLVLPNGLQKVGDGAFAECSSLEKVVIPNSVKSIGSDAFADCMNLYSVTSLINMPFKLNESAFRYTGKNYNTDVMYMAATLYVPRGKTAMYQLTEGWQKFLNVMETDTKFKITYVLDGEEYKTYEIQATEVITPEPDPYKEGYIFSGWSEIPYLMPAQDVTVTGHFTIDPDGIGGVSKDVSISMEFYTIDGRRIATPKRGINIIRMSDGTVRKVMVK